MVAPLVRLAVRRSLRDTRHVRVVPRRRATGLVSDVYRQVERDFGMLAPPVALHSTAPQTLAASWAILRETLLASGNAARADKEAVATGVSEANDCPYCADVHGLTRDAIADASDGPERTALTEWARRTATADGADAPPCPPDQVAELVGVAVAFHYFNRVANVFLRDSPFPAHVPVSARPRARQVLGRAMRPSALRGARPGAALDLLAPAAVPDDLAWARPTETVAAAFARAFAATQAVGDGSVPFRVRTLLETRLASWYGENPGISRSWADELVSALPPEERAAGKLALIVAFAPYQIDETLVDDLRKQAAPDDASLVTLVSWGSMAAARRMSSWFSGMPLLRAA